MKCTLGPVCALAIIAAGCGGQERGEELQKPEPGGTELSTSCVGVMPEAAPPSWTRAINVDSDSSCGVDTSDASGNVILGRQFGAGGNFDSEQDVWDIFTTVGHQRGTTTQFDGARIFPQEWGFMTLGDQNGCGMNPFCTPVFALASWTANGTLIRATTPTFDVRDAQLDLAGGVALVGLRPQQPFTIVSERFDAHSNPLAFQAVIARGTTEPLFVATGVSVSGLSLVLWNGEFSGFAAGSIVGRWVNPFGQAVTGTFLVARDSGNGNVSATSLVDGSMAIRVGTADGSAHVWVAQVHSGSTAVSAVPDWLATRPEAHVFIVRGGRAYALLFPIDPSTCGPAHVALFAPAGNRCGGFDLDSGAPGPTCATTIWTARDRQFASYLGRDGTLIVRGVTADFDRNCKDRVVPALLR